MTTFLLTYRAPNGYQPGSPDVVEAWRRFFGDLGDHVVEMGNPVFSRASLGSGVSDTALGGYSIISAHDLDEATALAKGCPFLEIGGGIEVGEITHLDKDSVKTTVDHARAAGVAA